MSALLRLQFSHMKFIDRLEPHLNGDKEPAIRDYFLWSFPGGAGGWLAINPAEGANLDDKPGLEAP